MLTTHPKYGYFTLASPPSSEVFESFYAAFDREAHREKVLTELEYWNAIFDLRLSLIESHHSGKGRLLDVGAGTGEFLDFAKKRGWEPEGIEPTTSMALYIQDNYGIKTFSGFFEKYQNTGELFDVIHSTLVLEHVLDPEEFVKQAYSLLNDNGLVLLEVPNEFNVLQEAIVDQLDKPQWWIAPQHHINYFSFDSLSALLEGNGFEVIERLSTFPMEFFPLMGLDYIGDNALGTQAHKMRMAFEKNLLQHNPQTLLTLYRSLAAINIGRTCTLIARKHTD